MFEIFNMKFLKLALWKWILIFIGLIILIFNFKATMEMLNGIFMIIGFFLGGLAGLAAFTGRPRMATKFGVLAVISFLLMLIASLLGR